MKKMSLVLAVILMLTASAGCTVGTLPTPVIIAFESSTTVITAGSPVTLTWQVFGATSVRIEPGVGDVPASGSKVLIPTSTVAYTLIASNEGGTATKSLVITVNSSSTPPSIVTFEVTPDMITLGATAILRWEVSGASSVRIEPGLGDVPLTGSRQVSPVLTTTYVVTAVNASGSASKSVTLSIRPQVGLPSIITFNITPTVISLGQAATLQWSVTGATDVRIDPGIGIVPSIGARIVTPGTSGSYTLTASNDSGVVNRTVFITVAQAPQLPVVLNFSANPGTILLGEPVTLIWNVVGASRVIIDTGVGDVPATGMRVVYPTSTTVYTLTAANVYGVVTSSAIVTIRMTGGLPSVVVFNVNPNPILSGQAATVEWQVVGAVSVFIDPSIGLVPASGVRTIAPATTTTYTLTATGGMGAVFRSVTVVVLGP